MQLPIRFSVVEPFEFEASCSQGAKVFVEQSACEIPVGTPSARVLRASRREVAVLLLPSTAQRVDMIRKLYCTSGEYFSVTARWNLLYFLRAVARHLIT